MCGQGHCHHPSPCRCGGRMERFLEPCLLLLLHEGPAHGYELRGRLERFGLDPDRQDPGLLYRTLRRLEEEDFLISEWETAGSGPAKRLYRITEDGEKLLHEWAKTLERNVARLEEFLQAYRERFGATP